MVCRSATKAEPPAIVVACHLVISTPGTNANPQRAAQVSQLLEVAGMLSTEDAVHVIAGDFNSDPTQPEMAMLANAGFTDAAPPEPGLTWDQANPYTNQGDPESRDPDARIDYVWVKTNRPWERPPTATARLVFNESPDFVSDHFGLLACVG